MRPQERNSGAYECGSCGALVYGRRDCFRCGAPTVPLTPELAVNAAARLAAKWGERAREFERYSRFWQADPPSHWDEKREYEEAREAIDNLHAAIRALKA